MSNFNPTVRGGWKETSTTEGTYASNGDQWVSYDNVASVRRKAEYIKRSKLGGAMVFAIDMDDFNNRCCYEDFPLIKAIGRVLGVRYDAASVTGQCYRPPKPVTPLPPLLVTQFDPSTLYSISFLLSTSHFIHASSQLY